MMIVMASRATKTIGIRFTHRQVSALQDLPEGISIAVFVRALLDAYLDGCIPYMNQRVLQEQNRTENAVENSYFRRGE